MTLPCEGHSKEHPLCRLDVRLKLILALAALCLVISYSGFIFPLFIILLSLFLSYSLKVSRRAFLLRLIEPIFIVLVIVILKLFTSGTTPLFSVSIFGWVVSGYREGLLEGLIIAARILAAVSIVCVVSFSTPFTEFLAGLSWLRIPPTLVEVLTFAYRYIFVFLEDAQTIYNSQKNRLGYSSLSRGLKSFATLTGSLVLKTFEQSHNITLAMIQRGYDGQIPLLKKKSFPPRQVIAAGLVISVFLLVWQI